jgi:formylglycine-generating enzyme required for sulfatase activity
LTDVGAYTASPSPYGTFDQTGDAFQWNDGITGGFRIKRGGSWGWDLGLAQSSFRFFGQPARTDDGEVGFRVATAIPEPSSAALAIIACGMMRWWRKRFDA